MNTLHCAPMYVTHPSMSVYSSHLQVTPPESVKQRYWHSITASKLGPGLTHVLVFGGRHESGEAPIAETATLEFGMCYCINLFCSSVLIACMVTRPELNMLVISFRL